MKNSNYPTWLVPIEIAKKLKEIGFNEACPFIVYPNDDEVVVSGTVTVEEDWLDEDNYGEVIIDLPISQCNTFNKLNFQTIPTWEQVLEWFRGKGFIGGVYYRYRNKEDKGFSYEIIGLRKLFPIYNTYEEAREALVKALIRTYKNDKTNNK